MRTVRSILIVVLLLVGGLIAADQAPRKIVHREDAEYPAVAAKNSIRGTVKLRVWIAPDGTVRRVEYIGGHPLLAESALKSVKNWKYEPAKTESTDTVEIKF